MTLHAYSCDLCPVSDTTRTLSGIILIGIGLSESEDCLRTSGFKNTLLTALDGDIVERLRLQPVQFEVKHEIEYPGDPIDRLYFLEEGMASITTTFEDGSQVEVGMFGYESVIGVSALMGTKKSLNRVYTQIAGHGYTCHVEDARREFDLGGDFHSLALRYVQAQLLLAMQSAGCNAKHNSRIVSHLLVAHLWVVHKCSTGSRFRMTLPNTCLGVAVPLFLRQPGFSSEKDLSNTPLR